MMNKHIRSVFLLDETEPFLVAKPFYGTIGHDNILLSFNLFKILNLEDTSIRYRIFLQKRTAPPSTDAEAELNKLIISLFKPKAS
jgi:hypothetical protein